MGVQCLPALDLLRTATILLDRREWSLRERDW